MRQLIFLILCLWCIALPVTYAQDTITFGQPVSGEITSGQGMFAYTFDGVEGDTLYIYMHSPSEDLVPMIRLTALGGVVVAQVDSNNPGGALLGPLTLEGSTTYTVEATHPEWAADSTGPFSLVLDRVNATPLEPGVAFSGSLPDATTLAFFSYAGSADDVIRYHATGSNLGIGVFLPDGQPAFYDGFYDDPGSLFNILPQDGSYTLFAQTGNDGGTDYTLTVSPLEVFALDEGTPVTGTSEETSPVVLSFDSEQGKLLAINASVPGADSRTIGIFPASNPCCDLTRDDGSGPNGNPRIDPFIVPETGRYYVVLWYDLYSEANAVLDYEVVLGASTLISLSPGTEITDAVTPESGIKSYSYNASLGESLRLTLTRTGGDGGLFIRVTGGDGGELMSFEDWSVNSFEAASVPSFSFEIVFPAAGLYRFEIGNTDYDATAVEYTLRVDAGS